MDKINFENLPSTNSPINATNLNQMQDNIENGMCVAVYGEGDEKGLIDPNTTLEDLILTQHANNPSGGSAFYYIKTIFYASIRADGNRSQIAIGYKVNKMYQRYYYNGNWSEWVPVLDDTGWQEATLLNDWANYGESFATVGYRKTGKQVALKGLVKSGTAGTIMFNLPEDYRPATIKMFVCLSNNQTVSEIRVRASGDVEVKCFGSSWISLDNISFFVD